MGRVGRRPPGQSPAAVWAQVPLYDVDQRVGLCDIQGLPGPECQGAVSESNFRATVVLVFLNEPAHVSPLGSLQGRKQASSSGMCLPEAHGLHLLQSRLCVHGSLQGDPGQVSAE